MFSISNDERQKRTDLMMDRAEYERDYYRNALILLCEGKPEVVKDVMSESRRLYTKKLGWKY